MLKRWMSIVVLAVCLPGSLEAGVGNKVVQESVEWMTRKFGKEVAAEGAERLSTRMTQLAAKHHVP